MWSCMGLPSGTLNKIGSAVTGQIPQILNPALKVAVNVGAALLPAPVLLWLQVSFQNSLMGCKIETLRGCSRWVEFGGQQMKWVCFSWFCLMTSMEKCEEMLSLITACNPSAHGRITFSEKSKTLKCQPLHFQYIHKTTPDGPLSRSVRPGRVSLRPPYSVMPHWGHVHTWGGVD